MIMVGWLLVCMAVAYGEDSRGNVDYLLNAKEKEMQQMFLDVEEQLSAAQQVAGLFVLEDAQLEMFALETRAKLRVVQEEVRQEIADTRKEVEVLQQTAVENVTTWRKTLEGVKDATQRNQQTLQRMRKEKEDKRQLEFERVAMELESQTEEESKQLQESEILQEFEKMNRLEREQKIESGQSVALETEQEVWLKLERSRNMEKHKMEKQCEQSKVSEASSSNAKGESVDMDKDARSFDGAKHEPAAKRMLAWYIAAEHALMEAVAILCRQFVLPVVVIIGFFLVLTVVIARYNAMKHARRNRRILYSGYPTSRPKPQPGTKPIQTDVRPRLRNPVPPHDSDFFPETEMCSEHALGRTHSK